MAEKGTDTKTNVVSDLFLPKYSNAGSNQSYKQSAHIGSELETDANSDKRNSSKMMDDVKGAREGGSRDLEDEYEHTKYNSSDARGFHQDMHGQKHGHEQEEAEGAAINHANISSDFDADTSMAVNTGMNTSISTDDHNPNYGIHHPIVEEKQPLPPSLPLSQSLLVDLEMKTPQKDLLSPPTVTRKIPGSDSDDKQKLTQTKLFRESPKVRFGLTPIGTGTGTGTGISKDDSLYRTDGVNHVIPFQMNYMRADNKTSFTENSNVDKDIDADADAEDTNSLISEYGSEVGEVKFRLEDVEAMDALAEGSEEEECVELDIAVDHPATAVTVTVAPLHVHRYEREMDNVFTAQIIKEKDSGLISNMSEHQKYSPDMYTGRDQNNDGEDDDLSQDASVDSIDLASQHEGQNIEYIATRTVNNNTNAKNETDTKDSTPPRKSISPQLKPADRKENIIEPPLTPIGAVSAALRRFGNGVSHMTRCSKSPPYPDEKQTAWLSPRFNNQESSGKKHSHSITQPSFGGGDGVGGSPWVRRHNRSTARSGITACLSFDPERGRRPYGFMNQYGLESPPSSPLPTHRRSRSWGSGGSEYFVGNLKELYDVGNVQVLDPQSMEGGSKTLGSRPSRPPGGTLSPRNMTKSENANIASTPQGTTRFCEDQYSSASKKNFNKKHALLLQSPQRVGDIEREDALDLLSLFVERSVAFHENSESSTPDKMAGQNETQVEEESMSMDVNECIRVLRDISKGHDTASEEESDPNHSIRMEALDALENSHTYAMEMKQAALSASTWLNAIGRTGKNASNEVARQPHCTELISDDKIMHMNVDELRSLVQATHMEIVTRNDMNIRLDHELSICRAEIGRLRTISRNEPSYLALDKSILDTEVDDDDDSSTSSATSSRNEFPDNSSSVFMDMNASTQNVQSYTSNNDAAASMVDAKKEILLLKAELEETNRVLKSMEQGIKWPTPGKKENDVAEQNQTLANQNVKGSSQDGGQVADETLESKHQIDEQLEAGDEPDDKDPSTSSKHEMASILDPQVGCESNSSIMMDTLKDELEAYVSAIRAADIEEMNFLKNKIKQYENTRKSFSDPDEKMINVRMLNAENFVTEWDKVSSLPPIPDHDLRSPIVTTLLSQWTNETTTQESLLSWVEEVINGQECNDIPPLHLSGLDHQVREGFTMHILPFLLRRSDIHVEVTTRAHRETSYDLSVAISRSENSRHGSMRLGQNQKLPEKSEVNLTPKNPHMMAFKASSGASVENTTVAPASERSGLRGYISSALDTGSVTHSTITAPISNNITSSSQMNRFIGNNGMNAQLAEDSRSSHGSSINENNSPHQQGIMAGALNAVGGLLSRRKHSANYDNELNKKNLALTLQTPHVQDTTSDMQEDSQSYHRVVSAPPGRIGMTFVQYRGHAIISDVYKDSPLAGWVFPSDILIAIDEVPVSGMRVPEIVKLLTARKERQRALRVISSHAMSELITDEQNQ